MIADNDLLSMQQARILAENAREAQKKLAALSPEKLDAAVGCIAGETLRHARELALMSHEETGFGKPEDKEFKNRFVCGRLAERLRGMRCLGVLNESSGGRILEVGVPRGVIAAVCPATSPVSTTICKALLAIKSGNAIVFSPHPLAEKSIGRVLDIMSAAALSCGLPEGCLSRLATVTGSGCLELMRHPAVSLLMLTGAPEMLCEARGSGKPLIYGGSGNGPAFVERSADLGRAAADIVISKTFDNGIAPSAEQSVVVDAKVEPEFAKAMQERGAYFMNEDEAGKLAALFAHSNGRHRRGAVGLDAPGLARRAGFPVPEKCTLLLAPRRYVSDSDVYSGELLAPVLAWYVEDDWMHACEKCIELLLFDRNAHTMIIHTRDQEVIRQFALKKPVGRLLVNTPGALGGMGVTSDLFPSMILGGGASGFGITADNVSPLNLVYVRKVGYGENALAGAGKDSQAPGEERVQSGPDKLRAMRQILLEAARVLGD